MTGPEKRLWKALRKTGLHIRRQAPIGRYIADFACHEARVVIEVDGWGKGRNGDEHAASSGMSLEVGKLQEPAFRRLARTPTQPSPIEGEGAVISDIALGSGDRGQ